MLHTNLNFLFAVKPKKRRRTFTQQPYVRRSRVYVLAHKRARRSHARTPDDTSDALQENDPSPVLVFVPLQSNPYSTELH